MKKILLFNISILVNHKLINHNLIMTHNNFKAHKNSPSLLGICNKHKH